jgi:hypothetical protein
MCAFMTAHGQNGAADKLASRLFTILNFDVYLLFTYSVKTTTLTYVKK